MTPRAQSLILVVLTFVLWSVVFYLFIIDASQHVLIDLRYAFLAAAHDMSAGRTIYGPPYPIPLQGTIGYFPNQHPPFLSALLIPFLRLDQSLISLIWCGLQFVAALGVSLIGARILASRFAAATKLQLFLMSSLLVACFEPVYVCVRLGQTDLFILLLVLWCLCLLREQKYGSAGVCLAISTCLKIAPALLVLVFLGQRRWKALVAFCATGAVAWLLLALSPVPAGTYLGFFRVALRSDVNNILSTDFAFARSVLELLGVPWAGLSGLALRLGWCLVFAVLALLQPRGEEGSTRCFALLLCSMLAFMPTVHFQTLMWLFPAWLVLVLDAPVKVTESTQFERHLTHAGFVYFALSQSNLLVYQGLQHGFLKIANVMPALVVSALAVLLYRGRRPGTSRS